LLNLVEFGTGFVIRFSQAKLHIFVRQITHRCYGYGGFAILFGCTYALPTSSLQWEVYIIIIIIIIIYLFTNFINMG
jgi:hypothetical protein